LIPLVKEDSMKTWMALALLCGSTMVAQETQPIKATFHNCTVNGGTSNMDGYQTMSEVYACDEGNIELKGRWSMTIEYGAVFDTKLGRPDGEPHRATDFDLQEFKWCPTPHPWDAHQKELCGLPPPPKCWDGKPPRFDKTGDWTCVDKTNSWNVEDLERAKKP
jgi:hypothetical protein